MRKRPCRICRKWFRPDARVGHGNAPAVRILVAGPGIVGAVATGGDATPTMTETIACGGVCRRRRNRSAATRWRN